MEMTFFHYKNCQFLTTPIGVGTANAEHVTIWGHVRSHWWTLLIDDVCLVAGAGIGSVFGSLVIGYARNPSLKQQLFSYAILGFALSEAMGLFCLMMAFLILFAF